MSAASPSAWPQVLFVMGKGGVGRSTVSGALALAFAGRGERVLIMEWTVAEALAPWFGLPPIEAERIGAWKWLPRPRELTPRVSVLNYRLQEALRGYFVDHLGLERFYARVINGPHLRRLVEAAPGISELLFVGQLWWMTELAPREAGLAFDRIIVDAPATGHGASLLDLPATVSSIGATGLLALEVQRLVKMIADPKRVGALVVSLCEELSVEECTELVPRLEHDLKRKPLLAVVNRAIPGAPPPVSRGEGETTLALIREEFRSRRRMEAELRARLEGRTDWGTWSLPEQLALVGEQSPREVLESLLPHLPLSAGARAAPP